MLNTELLQNSIRRAEQVGDFGKTFYDVFVSKDQAIGDYFRDTDFGNQRKIILASVKMLTNNYRDDHRTHEMLENIAHTHNRNNHNIDPKWYDVWLDSLCETLSVMDPEFDTVLENMWREHLSDPIQYIISGY